MNREIITKIAKASGLDVYSLGHDREKWLLTLDVFTVLILSIETKSVLETIEALYDSEDPNYMYQDGYNHALDHIRQFVTSNNVHIVNDRPSQEDTRIANR
jgi:hypothetical protein